MDTSKEKAKGVKRTIKQGAEKQVKDGPRKLKAKKKVNDRRGNLKERLHHQRTMPVLIASLIILLGVLNILSIVIPYFTEVLNIPSIAFFPLDEFAEAGNFIHAIIGLLLMYLGYNLYHRRRGAWTLILFFLFFSFLASLLSFFGTAAFASIITGLLSFNLMFVLFLYKDQFSTPSIFFLSPKRMSAILFSLIMVIYGIVGSKILGADFDKPLTTWTDAIYFTITTMTTVGFGDHTPMTQASQWFTIVLMVFGFSAFILVIGSMIGPYVEGRLLRVIGMVGSRRTERLSDHLIICGLSTEARIAVETLKSRKELFVVVCGSEEKHDELLAEGINLVHGDPSETDTLKKVAIKKARALLAISEDDALNAFITITARKMAPDLPIIAMVSSRENMAKLKSVGADKVISPSIIGAQQLLGAALDEEDIICG